MYQACICFDFSLVNPTPCSGISSEVGTLCLDMVLHMLRFPSQYKLKSAIQGITHTTILLYERLQIANRTRFYTIFHALRRNRFTLILGQTQIASVNLCLAKYSVNLLHCLKFQWGNTHHIYFTKKEQNKCILPA